MFAMTPIVGALALLLCASAWAAPTAPGTTPRSLLSQAKGLPEEFEAHFFDVPLAVRMELDQQYLGEAMVVLTRDDRMTLLEFTDTQDSPIPAVERGQWEQLLKQGLALGACEAKCTSGLLAVHYSLEHSLVSILTEKVERGTVEKRYYDQPQEGSLGLILNNQLNLNGGQEQDTGGRYGLNASSSIGNWTQSFDLQLSRLGGPDDKLYHAVHELHTQREMQDSFLRLGYFMPGSDGLNRQIRSFGANPDTALGVMYGSSDSLVINNPKPSVYPIYVTASRQAAVEIYRNGLLINTQAVSAGLQSLDTRPLPGGIYEVEVRLIEDGQTTATSQELVYKPSNWRSADDRWRYNLFAGRETKLLSNWDDQPSGFMTAGVGLNYLLHPRVVWGLSTRQVQDKLQYGSSVDWTLPNNTSLFANVYQTEQYGTGMDLQALYSYGLGSVVASHNRSWLDTRNTYEILPDGTRIRQRDVFVGQTSNSSLSVTHRLSNKSSINGRLFYSEGNVQGTGVDLGWTQRSKLGGSEANWRWSVFDRPGTSSTADRRNRGVDLSVSVALGGPGEYWSGSIGTRTSRDGTRDHNGSLTYRRDLQDHVLQSVSATALADSYGVGLSGLASFDTDTVYGDGFIQRSSYNDNLTGGLNLSSTVAVGGRKVAFTGLPQSGGAGMIVDVETDLDDIVLLADDLTGGSTTLRPGRNFVPITAYQNSLLTFDFDGVHPPAANIEPSRSRYHLNKGGVDYRKVSVMRSVTVLGRLLDAQGQPLKGHHVINHASRGVSEVDGFFSMEMNASSPTLEVRYGNDLLCQFRLDPDNANSEGDVLMIGDLRCTPDTLADRNNPIETAG
ncbi:TcfC E-set like domain-containing protein [Pseudomonas fluorescens]|uniref:CS1-pili formation C-terminal domain-containing protein n=1 Tax=Pseudomonas fluorescens TaxID=294 RepID=A0A944DJD6_PSEFL|nr:TcfC E-set like domain-containing protein [Pseudomonas fluorescens]MBT2298721.1 CS1-pili formation C-terminal domain-containing protein [Pseudomonas fluorescens]MBT2309888.1 CS1-pili formation C-terminal domain-containing protein [Pseudomonas fluorescens]MBT2315443.1 CS1-pili formation C-terminal domain-containing protein [Pseudomonas fluorescens]MBT2315511.1 CS1-pili formation C-terminal domain-containing protein [Pseudomonas fluorescens]MBT2328818.1 CS1-pili formation C-terminal domain-co